MSLGKPRPGGRRGLRYGCESWDADLPVALLALAGTWREHRGRASHAHSARRAEASRGPSGPGALLEAAEHQGKHDQYHDHQQYQQQAALGP
jgi:hypothetical protein